MNYDVPAIPRLRKRRLKKRGGSSASSSSPSGAAIAATRHRYTIEGLCTKSSPAWSAAPIDGASRLTRARRRANPASAKGAGAGTAKRRAPSPVSSKSSDSVKIVVKGNKRKADHRRLQKRTTLLEEFRAMEQQLAASAVHVKELEARVIVGEQRGVLLASERQAANALERAFFGCVTRVRAALMEVPAVYAGRPRAGVHEECKARAETELTSRLRATAAVAEAAASSAGGPGPYRRPGMAAVAPASLVAAYVDASLKLVGDVEEHFFGATHRHIEELGERLENQTCELEGELARARARATRVTSRLHGADAGVDGDAPAALASCQARNRELRAAVDEAKYARHRVVSSVSAVPARLDAIGAQIVAAGASVAASTTKKLGYVPRATAVEIERLVSLGQELANYKTDLDKDFFNEAEVAHRTEAASESGDDADGAAVKGAGKGKGAVAATDEKMLPPPPPSELRYGKSKVGARISLRVAEMEPPPHRETLREEAAREAAEAVEPIAEGDRRVLGVQALQAEYAIAVKGRAFA